jgi:hypothetical protein
MLISGAPIGALGDGDGDVAGGDGFAYVLAVQMGLDILEPCDGFGVEREQNVSDYYAGIVSGAARFDFKYDCGGFFPALECLSKILGEANRLQSDAEIATGNTALREERIHHAVHCGDGQGEGSHGSEFWSGDAGHTAFGVNNSATDSGALQGDIQANVGREGKASPEAALTRNHADDGQRSNGAASASASHDERDVAGVERGCVAERRNGGVCLFALQYGDVARGITTNEFSAGYLAVWKCHLDIFVALQGVLGGDDDAGPPDHAAG